MKKWQIGIVIASGGWYWWFTPVAQPVAFPCSKLAAKREKDNSLLLQWVKFNGGHVDNITIGVDDHGRRGVFAIKDIPSGSTVFSVPEICMIDQTNLNQSPSIKKFIFSDGTFHEKFDPDKWDHCTSALSLFILEHRHKGKNSFFHPYIETLPKEQQLPAILDGYQMPEDKEIADHLASLANRCHEVFDHICEFTTIAKEDWLWAYGNVETRSFQNVGMSQLLCDSFSYFTGFGDYNPWNIACFPLGDMVNHSDQANVDYFRESYSMVANRDIQANEEICWNYRPNARTEEMRHYYNLF